MLLSLSNVLNVANPFVRFIYGKTYIILIVLISAFTKTDVTIYKLDTCFAESCRQKKLFTLIIDAEVFLSPRIYRGLCLFMIKQSG